MLDVKAVDGDGVERVSRILEGVRPYDLKALPRAERDAALRKLKSSGMTVREIERATSIGRNIIARA
jgi:ribosomal protein S11